MKLKNSSDVRRAYTCICVNASERSSTFGGANATRVNLKTTDSTQEETLKQKEEKDEGNLKLN